MYKSVEILGYDTKWSVEEDPRLPQWLNTVLNWPPFLLAQEWIFPVFMFTSGYISSETGQWVWWDFTNQTPQLFRNGVFCFRIMLPFYVGIQFRWSGSTTTTSYVQFLVGWKLSGRFTISLRALSDASAAAGTLFPNTDQSAGWIEGGK